MTIPGPHRLGLNRAEAQTGPVIAWLGPGPAPVLAICRVDPLIGPGAQLGDRKSYLICACPRALSHPTPTAGPGHTFNCMPSRCLNQLCRRPQQHPPPVDVLDKVDVAPTSVPLYLCTRLHSSPERFRIGYLPRFCWPTHSLSAVGANCSTCSRWTSCLDFTCSSPIHRHDPSIAHRMVSLHWHFPFLAFLPHPGPLCQHPGTKHKTRSQHPRTAIGNQPS